jgi:hypothetical protein
MVQIAIHPGEQDEQGQGGRPGLRGRAVPAERRAADGAGVAEKQSQLL